MKRKILASIFFFGISSFILAQKDSLGSKWEINVEANNYFFPDDYILLPVFHADKGKLHLEARYNYEDLNTFSAWAGINFGGGDKFTYNFTPMIGAVVGNSNGLAPGIEMTLCYKRFELYSEGETLFDLKTVENNFIYFWSDLSYSFNDWFYAGLSAQRTRLYKTELDVQSGLFVGGSFKNWELTGYFYNLTNEDRFGLVTLGYNF